MIKPMLLVLVAGLCGCAVSTRYEPDMRSPQTITICHKQKQTLVLPDDAVTAHLNHGDTYGPCP